MNRVHWVLVLWLTLALSTLIQMFTYQYFRDYNYEILDYFVTPLSSMLTGIFLFFVLILPIFDRTSSIGFVKRLFLLAFIGIIYSFLFILFLHLFPLVLYDNPTNFKDSIIGFFVSNFHNVIKNYLFQIAILFIFEYLSKEKLLIIQQKDLEVELNQTKLELLKSQLHPHFLFNSLNSVVAEIDVNPKNAQEMVIHLSDILRETLESNFNEAVSLEEELELIQKYLAIEKIRYEDQLKFKIQADKDSLNLTIPKLILLPLVENAIKHGFKGNQKGIEIQIIANFNEKSVLVQNNGSTISENLNFRTGLQNVSERLKIFTQKENSFEIYQDGSWVVNKMKLK